MAFYAVNVQIAKCIAFYGGWDCGMVANSARWVFEGGEMGYGDYYSIYTNNVPITWLLYRLYSCAANSVSYPYNPEFVWIQFQCAQHALAVFLAAVTMLMITKKISGCLLTLLLTTLLLGLSPWKIIPYTDGSSIVFPIAVFFLYTVFVKTKSRWKYVIWFLLGLIGLFGGLLKATCYVVLISVVLTDLWLLLFAEEGLAEKIKNLLCRGTLLVCAFLLISLAKGGMYRALGYEYNRDKAMGWMPCLYVGLNEETTGACSGDGLEMVRARTGNKKESSVREWNSVLARIKEKGAGGLLDFWWRKNVMTYNDGTFSWFQEGYFQAWEYETLTDSKWKEPLREFYWQDGENYDWFVTFSHWLWLFLMVGIILEAATMLWQNGCKLLKNEKGKKEDSTEETAAEMAEILYFIGLFLFLTLFEGRARYLYNGVAVFTLMAVTGYCKTFELLASLLKRTLRKERKNAYNFP